MKKSQRWHVLLLHDGWLTFFPQGPRSPKPKISSAHGINDSQCDQCSIDGVVFGESSYTRKTKAGVGVDGSSVPQRLISREAFGSSNLIAGSYVSHISLDERWDVFVFRPLFWLIGHFLRFLL